MKADNRNLFRLTRFILLKLPYVFKVLAPFRKPAKRLLIIKTDAIGDYILFRNFIEVVALSDRYKDYSITLLGNEIWQDMAMEYDGHFIAHFVFINAGELYQLPLKTLRIGWQLFKNNYEVVLQPAYTRLLITDGLAALTAAKQIAGFTGDNEGILPQYKTKTDKFYTALLLLPQGIEFEFYRNRFFFERVLDQNIRLNGPVINMPPVKKQGIVIFIGAGVSKRRWETEKFLALIKLITDQYPLLQIIIAGGIDDMEAGNYLVSNMPQGNINNLTGKTTLTQLVDIIAGATLVISNETSATHIAAATQTQSVCILGGGHFGRFAPYQADMPGKPLCVYQKMECYNCNWVCKFTTLPNEPFPCLSVIDVLQVWGAVNSILALCL